MADDRKQLSGLERLARPYDVLDERAASRTVQYLRDLGTHSRTFTRS